VSIDINVQSGSLSVGGDLVGRDKIVNNIQNIVQRALTASEAVEQDKALESKYFAQGVQAFCERLKTRATEAAETVKGSPYKGLLEYRLSDAEIFYGRSQAIAALMGNLKRSPLTILHAESGAGKTSLVQAGIMPRLIAAGHLPIYLRPYNAEPSYAIKRLFIPDLSNVPLLATAPLRDFLKQLDGWIGADSKLYIFLDQFEEFFTQLEEPARAEFVRELAECIDDESIDVHWVLAMRTEFFGNLASFRPAIRNPFDNDLRLNRLTRQEAREVAIEPAARRGITFEFSAVDAMLDDLGGQFVPPPQIQLVCAALYEELPPDQKIITKAAYDSLGGAAGILRGHLQRVLTRDLLPEQRPVAQRTLEALISADGRRLIRPRAKLVEDLAASGQLVKPETLDTVLDQLLSSRLLRVPDAAADAAEGYEAASGLSYELTHDYLLEQIKVDPTVQARKAAQELIEQETQNYQRFKTLLSDDKLAILAPRKNELHLSDSAKKLLEQSQQAIRQRQGFVRAGIGLVVILVLLGALSFAAAIVGQGQQHTAQTQAALAGLEKVTAEAAATAAAFAQATSEDAARKAQAQSKLALDVANVAATHQAEALAAEAAAASRAEAAKEVVRNLFEKSGLVPVGRLPVQIAFDGQRLWVVNRNDSSIQSINPSTGEASPAIPIGAEIRAIAFDGTRLWVADSKGGAVYPVDPATGGVGQPVRVGSKPRALLVAGHQLWIANHGDNTVQTIDLTTDTLISPTIPVDGGPISLAYDGARVWVANYFSDTVQAIDPRTRQTGQTYHTPGPWALAYDGARLWVANYDAHTVQPINLSLDFTSDPVPVGHNPIALKFDGERVWVSCYGDNLIQAIDPQSGLSGVPIPVGILPDGMAFDGARIWVANRSNNTVQSIDAIAGDLLLPRPVADAPQALAFDGDRLWIAYPERNVVKSINRDTGAIIAIHAFGREPNKILFDGRYLWVLNHGDNTVQALDIKANKLRSPIRVAANPAALASDGTRLWVASGDENVVQVIDPAAQTVMATIAVGGGPAALAFDGRYVWVANRADQTVQAIDQTTLTTDGLTTTIGAGVSAMVFDGQRLWVANGDDDTVQSIDTATRQAEAPIAIGNNPQALAFVNKLLWIANNWSNDVQVVNPMTRQVGKSIPVGIAPIAFAFDGHRLWLANHDSKSLQYVIIR